MFIHFIHLSPSVVLTRINMGATWRISAVSLMAWMCHCYPGLTMLWSILVRTQGSKFSDFSLISDFFPTPRTILEISVNLKRIFFEGEGVGVLEYSDLKWHWNAPFATPDPLERGCFISGSFNEHVHTPPSSALHAFQTFWSKPILIPGTTDGNRCIKYQD